MVHDFRNKVALVTGGSRGIGRSTATLLGYAGAKVVICHLQDDDAAEAAASAVRSSGGTASIRRFDVADPEECARAVDSVIEEHGGLHVLVNNAGITADGLVMRLRDEDWQRSLDVNLSGVLYLCRAASRPMIKQREGSIVNVTSVVAQTGNAGQVAYASAKGGVVALTRTLARELASRNIRVNAVSPGWIDTDMTASLSDDVKSRAISKVPLGRSGRADEVAKAIAFLASNEASYVTGHVLNVNGGMHM